MIQNKAEALEILQELRGGIQFSGDRRILETSRFWFNLLDSMIFLTERLPDDQPVQPEAGTDLTDSS